MLIRETWDYFYRFAEFSNWLDQQRTRTQLINSYDLLKWNGDKHYLADLEKKGIRIVPSFYIEQGDQRTLAELHKITGWIETVVKPVVSGGARHTYRLNPDNYEQHDQIIAPLLQKEAFMLQPFMNSVPEKGEVSHMVFGGQYTHSVLKKAKSGDYRVQDDWGGTVHAYTASQEEITYVEKVVKACDELPFYARVDVVWDNTGELALGELELIEPELWFRECPAAADVLAEKIADFVKG